MLRCTLFVVVNSRWTKSNQKESVLEFQRIKSYWKSIVASNSSCIFLEKDPWRRQATNCCNWSRASQTDGYSRYSQRKRIPCIRLCKIFTSEDSNLRHKENSLCYTITNTVFANKNYCGLLRSASDPELFWRLVRKWDWSYRSATVYV